MINLRKALLTTSVVATMAVVHSAQAQSPVTVGGAPMFPNKNIVENAVNSKDHTTLVTAVKAAGLVDTLASPGPFTVFAPTNAAFAKLPAGTVDTLLEPENKDQLTKVLTYHVVAGSLDAQELVNRVARGNGSATLETVSGDTLTVTKIDSKRLGITDESGNTGRTSIFNVYQSNGVIHVVDTVLLPN